VSGAYAAVLCACYRARWKGVRRELVVPMKQGVGRRVTLELPYRTSQAKTCAKFFLSDPRDCHTYRPRSHDAVIVALLCPFKWSLEILAGSQREMPRFPDAFLLENGQ